MHDFAEFRIACCRSRPGVVQQVVAGDAKCIILLGMGGDTAKENESEEKEPCTGGYMPAREACEEIVKYGCDDTPGNLVALL